jgi:copper chaperone
VSHQFDQIVVVTPDMSCGHCVASIQREIGALAGVQSVTADLPTKQVAISFDSSVVTTATIEAALDDAGYPVAKEQVRSRETG